MNPPIDPYSLTPASLDEPEPRTRRIFSRPARLPFLELSSVQVHHDLLVLNQHEDLTDDPSSCDRLTIFNVDFP